MIQIADYDIGAAFQAIENELISSMIRNMDRHRAEETKEGIEWNQWQAEQLKALEKYKRENQKKYQKQFKSINGEIGALIQEARQQGNMQQEIQIFKAIQRGYRFPHMPKKFFDLLENMDGKTFRQKASALLEMFKGKEAARGTAEFFRLNDRKLEALIKATTNDMQQAETAVLRMANDQYRKAIFNAQVYANSGAGTYEKAVDMATKNMLSSGLNCMVYANGARHTLADYADMAIRTANKRAYLQGEGEKRQEWGITTVIVNKRGNPCPKCLPFCGKVLIDDVWSGGKKGDGPYPLMSAAIEAGLYHPRCKDSHTTYFPGISTADDKWTKEELGAVGQKYQAEQKRQYAARQAERFGRLAEYSLDKGNQKQYGEKSDQWNLINDSLISESANVENLRSGNNTVNLPEVKSQDFGKKFNQITQNSAVNDALRKYARAMLVHRNGTDGEDLYIIGTKTGKRLFSKIKGLNNLGVELSKDEIAMIKGHAKREGIIAIHNHPTNLYPTGSDFVTAGARGYDFGVVVTHDGKVFQYKTGSRPFRSEYFNKTVDKYVSDPYNYDIGKAQLKTLDEFGKEFGIEWKELN